MQNSLHWCQFLDRNKMNNLRRESPTWNLMVWAHLVYMSVSVAAGTRQPSSPPTLNSSAVMGVGAEAVMTTSKNRVVEHTPRRETIFSAWICNVDELTFICRFWCGVIIEVVGNGEGFLNWEREMVEHGGYWWLSVVVEIIITKTKCGLSSSTDSMGQGNRVTGLAQDQKQNIL